MEKGTRTQLKGLTIPELAEFFTSIGEPKYRAGQLFNWIYNHLADDFSDMQNLSKDLRNKLSSIAELKVYDTQEVQESNTTRTRKFLLTTHDNKNIESVVIPDKERNTLCISTQVGCPLDCKFCATGLLGYKRNLSAAEIVDQYLQAAKIYGKPSITNIVFMGMGEPLLNFENTLKAISIFTDELNTGLSRTRITVSTAGIPHKIKELAESGLRVKLALSLHSCFEDVRSTIMPINKKYALSESIEALKLYARLTKTRITFEYTMLKGVNDRPEDIKALNRLCSSLPSKMNIIPFNSIKHMSPGGISSELEPTSRERIHEFAQKLRDHNITVMIRDTQGDDIAAACGQLAGKHK
jgi:23S rRNA (adenine2503-C2)-methyltransferase